MVITIITYNGEKEVKQVINSPMIISQSQAEDIASDIYGDCKKKVNVR